MKKLYFFGGILGLFLSLWLVACNNSSIQAVSTQTAPQKIPANPIKTDTPSSTVQPHKIATQNAGKSLIPSTTPVPTKTLTNPLSLIQRQQELGLIWGIDTLFGDFIKPSSSEELPLLILRDFGTNRGLSIANANTGQSLVRLPFEEGRYNEYDASKNILYLTSYDDEDTFVTIQQWNIQNGELLWEKTISQDGITDLVATDEGVLLIDHQYGKNDNNSLFFLNSDGQILWQFTYGTECFVYKNDIYIVDNYFHIRCGEFVLNVEMRTGEIADYFEIDPGYYYDFAIVDQKAFMIRDIEEENTDGYNVKQHYLEARDLLTYDLLWSVPVAEDVYELLVIDDDVIYRTEDQVLRLNGKNGDILWQTAIASKTPTKMLLSDKLLLVGSRAGYLHLVDVENGELVWEQDIWATIEPRSVDISPIALLDEGIIISTGNGFLSLGISENMIWEQPTLIPTSTSTITPTPTQIPPFIIPQDGTLPFTPESYEIWPSAITTFLNADSNNLNRLEELLIEWSTSSSEEAIQYDLQTVDLNNDNFEETIILINSSYYAAGWVIVIGQDSTGQFSLAWNRPATMPEMLSIVDLNNDGTLDFVYADTNYGASQSYVTIIPVGWNGESFIDLSDESIASTNVYLDEVKIENIVGDEEIEIVIRGGTYGSLAAGPNRTSTFTYSMSDNGYILVSQEPVLPQDYYFFLVEANQEFVAGNLEEAISIYENSAWFIFEPKYLNN